MPWNDSCASEPLFTYFGFATAYGTSGFCNSEIGEAYYLDVVAGSGAPSGCAYRATSPDIGTPAVSGTCRGYAKPIWQWFLAGVPNDGVRDIPDVSLFVSEQEMAIVGIEEESIVWHSIYKEDKALPYFTIKVTLSAEGSTDSKTVIYKVGPKSKSGPLQMTEVPTCPPRSWEANDRETLLVYPCGTSSRRL